MRDTIRHHLQSVVPAARAGRWGSHLARAAETWGVLGGAPTLSWLANLLHESSGLQRLEESLAYTPARAQAVWPHRFPTLEAARQATSSPRQLANTVYNGRLGNRPGSDDGWRYRGRGLIQLTGRANYRAYAQASGHDVLIKPELLQTPPVAADAAAWYWHHRSLNDTPTFEAVVRGINGGLNGLADRKRWLAHLQEVGTPAEDASAQPHRMGEFDTLVLHDFNTVAAVRIARGHIVDEPTILRGHFVASRTPSGGGKLDVRAVRMEAEA